MYFCDLRQHLNLRNNDLVFSASGFNLQGKLNVTKMWPDLAEICMTQHFYFCFLLNSLTCKWGLPNFYTFNLVKYPFGLNKTIFQYEFTGIDLQFRASYWPARDVRVSCVILAKFSVIEKSYFSLCSCNLKHQAITTNLWKVYLIYANLLLTCLRYRVHHPSLADLLLKTSAAREKGLF